MYYGENFYIFGSKDENKFDAIYSSVDGISWREPQKKFLLHKDMTDITAPYSIVADSPIYMGYLRRKRNRCCRLARTSQQADASQGAINSLFLFLYIYKSIKRE